MTIKKFLFAVFLSQISSFVFGQSIYVLQLKNKKYFTEKDIYTSDSGFYILCEVCQDNPRINDDEYCNSISFTIADLGKFREGSVLDLEKDTLIVQSTYDRMLPFWRGNDLEKSKITGQIRLVSFKENEIKLELNVIVEAKQKYVYFGLRTFKRSKITITSPQN